MFALLWTRTSRNDYYELRVRFAQASAKRTLRKFSGRRNMLSKATAQRIEHWKLAKLTPYPRNPRRHSEGQIAQIAGSILAFGFNAPILVDAKGCILAGHGRYLASLKLALETVPVVVLEHLSEVEKRAYLLADKKLAALSSFDDDLLREELAELRDADIALGALGFSD